MHQPMQINTLKNDGKQAYTFSRGENKVYSEIYWFATYICPWVMNGVVPIVSDYRDSVVAYSESDLRVILLENSRIHSTGHLRTYMEEFTRKGWW